MGVESAGQTVSSATGTRRRRAVATRVMVAVSLRTRLLRPDWPGTRGNIARRAPSDPTRRSRRASLV